MTSRVLYREEMEAVRTTSGGKGEEGCELGNGDWEVQKTKNKKKNKNKPWLSKDPSLILEVSSTTDEKFIYKAFKEERGEGREELK